MARSPVSGSANESRRPSAETEPSMSAPGPPRPSGWSAPAAGPRPRACAGLPVGCGLRSRPRSGRRSPAGRARTPRAPPARPASRNTGPARPAPGPPPGGFRRGRPGSSCRSDGVLQIARHELLVAGRLEQRLGLVVLLAARRPRRNGKGRHQRDCEPRRDSRACHVNLLRSGRRLASGATIQMTGSSRPCLVSVPCSRQARLSAVEAVAHAPHAHQVAGSGGVGLDLPAEVVDVVVDDTVRDEDPRAPDLVEELVAGQGPPRERTKRARSLSSSGVVSTGLPDLRSSQRRGPARSRRNGRSRRARRLPAAASP